MGSVHFFALSERGLQGTNHDDYCAERIGAYEVFAVAGGNPGSSAGQQASEIAVTSLRDAVKKNSRDPAEILETAIADADAQIGALTPHDREHGMGTDLCACLIDDNMDCTILDTGNGGVYHISPGIGIVFPSEIPFSENVHPSLKKRVISHTLGEPLVLKSSAFSRVNLRDSFIVLSSGGLYDYVKREDIRSIVEKNAGNVETSCEELKDRALLAGSDKTITLIIIRGSEN